MLWGWALHRRAVADHRGDRRKRSRQDGDIQGQLSFHDRHYLVLNNSFNKNDNTNNNDNNNDNNNNNDKNNDNNNNNNNRSVARASLGHLRPSLERKGDDLDMIDINICSI